MSRAFLRRAFEAAQEAGDLSYAAYSCIDLTANLFASGAPLDQVEREAEIGIKFAQDVGFGLADNNLTVQFRLVRMLRGLTLDFGSFNDATFDESRFVQRFENNRELSICACWYSIRKLQAGIYVSNSVAAIAATTKVTPLLRTAPTQIEQSEYQFYGALAQAARCDEAPAEERSQHLAALAVIVGRSLSGPKTARRISRAALRWSERRSPASKAAHSMPWTFTNRPSVRPAPTALFTMRRSLTNWPRASTPRGAWMRSRISTYEMLDTGYARWGADGKVRQLDQSHPQLKHDPPVAGPTSTIGAPVEHLDLATVIKVSQAVCRARSFSKNCSDTLMRTAIEQAGAERGLLIVSQENGPRIAGGSHNEWRYNHRAPA